MLCVAYAEGRYICLDDGKSEVPFFALPEPVVKKKRPGFVQSEKGKELATSSFMIEPDFHFEVLTFQSGGAKSDFKNGQSDLSIGNYLRRSNEINYRNRSCNFTARSREALKY
jgi:hypothetical protein